MKAIDLTINVPEERVITLKLPEDINPGTHHIVMVIEQTAPDAARRFLFRTKGILAGGPDVSAKTSPKLAERCGGSLRG